MDREEILKILYSYKLSKSEIEYLYLQLYFTEQLNTKADGQIQEFHVEQKENRDSILNEIAKAMLSYPIIESIMSIGGSDKLKLKKQLNTLIQNKIQSELNSETLKTKELLESTGKNKYNINNYINDIGMNVNWDIKPVEDKILNDIINKKVDDKTWDDRLWNNKNDLQKDLKTEIDNFLNGKTTVNEIEDKIKKKYNSNAYETKRIVQDNIARVQEGINEQWREDHNVKWVLYMATLCHNTCGKCSQYDGKDYPVNKKPVDLPQHPFCRCTYVNLPNKDWRASQRVDNIIKEKVDWQTYEEWEKEYIKSTGAIGKVHKNDYKRKQKHAKTYYESIRKRNDDINSIAKNTGININTIKKVKEHVFINKYNLAQGYTNFYPDYEMAIAWQRLIDGKNIKKSDIVLLHHERLESHLMNRYNYTYEIAHNITCRKYNYAKALKED
ncbi:hypothetical protein [Clostridium sp.]|uniref:hypothetical protein n=1 Tax=Clostridium sp. TaxID=1506 RepID=UPI00204B179B|nr:hypothetical protein [Clostridium sp.]MDU4480144.1 hypothetical protein [Clostridium sp.]DAM15893.1 MAG TPA: minor capsid protein [Caudoviricetes sp.]